MTYTLLPQHLQYETLFQRMVIGFLFAESENEQIIIVHTTSGNLRFSVS